MYQLKSWITHSKNCVVLSFPFPEGTALDMDRVIRNIEAVEIQTRADSLPSLIYGDHGDLFLAQIIMREREREGGEEIASEMKEGGLF